MADIKIYFLKKEINKIKENLNINLNEVKEDFKEEAKNNIENFIHFLDNALTSNKKIDNIITDINSKINSFNDKINDIMKKSMELNPMVNVMPDLSADDFYEVKTFAENIKLTENEYFNKFADNENINDELLDRIISLDNQIKEVEKTDKSYNKENKKNLYKERAEIYNSLSMPSYAIEDCNKAIEIDANDINLKLLKLDILKKGNEVNADDIIKCYDDIINLDKNNLESYYKKIEYLESLGNRQDNIIKCFDDIIELDKNNAERYYKKLWYLQSLGNREEDVIKCYDDIINLNKNNLESYYKKIEYLESLVGRQEEIINCCNEILNIDSNNIKALYIIADEYRKQADKTSKEDDYKKALEYYNKVKSLDKNYNAYYEEYCLDKINYNENLQKEIKYYYDKAETFFELGRHKEAINCADKAVSLDEKYYKSYYFKGSLLKNIENYNEAIVCFDKAIEINDKDTDSYYNKALILFELKKYNESIEVMDLYLKIDDKNSNAYHYKGLCLYNLKKYDEALESFKSTNNFNKYDMYYFLGEIYEIKNNYKEAIKYYDEALKNYKEKNNARDYYIIGMTLYKLSLFDKAIDNFNKALSFIDNKNAEDILNYCNNILKLEKNNKVFYAYKIIALILLNKYDEALSLYNNIEKNNESLSRDELYQKALNILDENKIDVNSNKREEEDNKSDIKSLKEQINLLKSKGENYLVMEWYDKIIEANNQNIESYREKIEFAKSIGNSKAAIECYDKMMKLSPIEAYKGKAEIYRTLANENDSNKKNIMT
ncbi:tetratricopeptide repeat protein [Brachyspira pilosicoli]|uniref:Tetratricopeptide repeat protein n=1 Tax=Brachyspira pilosicoli TaxID=52584 RepID=A0A5C8FDC1_BRAPL|nr:tetratricopeptide repeat protein [Brachyspira pilosicoli]TXJ47071.1 tetratricopeptide repeat protein [Brachyspira pilosicoli]